MRSRGFSLFEVLIALAVTSVVVLAVASFYTQMVGAWTQGQLQVSLRRQANLVEREIGRIIGPALGLPPGSCGSPDDALALAARGASGRRPARPRARARRVRLLLSAAPAYRDSDLLMRCRFASLASTACIAEQRGQPARGGADDRRHPARGSDRPGHDTTTRGLEFIRTGGTTVDVSFNLSAFGPGDPPGGWRDR